MIQRRTLLGGAMAATLTALAPPALGRSAPTDKRLVFIMLRGAVDGLSILAPIGDPAFASQRGELGEDYGSAPRAGNDFAFHPELKNLAALYAKGDCLAHHAIASNYRERSHFDAQNVLESGGTRPYELRSGWLNRALAVDDQAPPKAMALATSIPLALRGPAPVSSYAPSHVPEASEDLMRRVSMLYAGDEQLHGLWESALETRELTGDDATKDLRNAEKSGQLAASLMRGDAGARVLMIEINGWDSHSRQVGQLNRMLRSYDALIGALQTGLGSDWANTLIISATEFGRTVKPNPSRGTDHGTAGAALLMGGSVNGGQVLGDWPGLADSQLYEGRDLKPTASLESLFAGAVADQFAMVPSKAAQRMFPGQAVTPMQDLLKG